jgi:flagellar basal-body rod protein FlgB
MFSADPVFALLSRAMDTTALRHAVHVANIANAGADDYHRLEVEVSSSSRAMDPMWEPSQPRVVRAADDSVQLDQEMAGMAQNAVRYQALARAFERTLELLRLAVSEGRGA